MIKDRGPEGLGHERNALSGARCSCDRPFHLGVDGPNELPERRTWLLVSWWIVDDERLRATSFEDENREAEDRTEWTLAATWQNDRNPP